MHFNATQYWFVNSDISFLLHLTEYLKTDIKISRKNITIWYNYKVIFISIYIISLTVTLDSRCQLLIAPTLVSHRSQEMRMQAWRDGSDILMVETALAEDPRSALSTHVE